MKSWRNLRSSTRCALGMYKEGSIPACSCSRNPQPPTARPASISLLLILIVHSTGRATQCRESPPEDRGAQVQLCRRPGSAQDYNDTVLPALPALLIVRVDTHA